MIGNTFEAFSGWSVGYTYATAKNKEEEIKQRLASSPHSPWRERSLYFAQ